MSDTTTTPPTLDAVLGAIAFEAWPDVPAEAFNRIVAAVRKLYEGAPTGADLSGADENCKQKEKDEAERQARLDILLTIFAEDIDHHLKQKEQAND